MNVGIVGAGKIVPKFLDAQRKIAELHVEAICASRRSQERMECLAKEYSISSIYYDYKTMLNDKCLQVIYIAVPNHLHYSFSKWALEHDKSVICEKPFCSNIEEAHSLAALAEERGLYLFEAISNQYFPNYQMVRELLPCLGDIKIVEMNYSQYSSRYDAFQQGDTPPVFDPEKSGGSLMDLNVYNIHFILGLVGIPEEILYFANVERNIDTSGILILRYPGFVCTAVAAKDCRGSACIRIQGNQGYIYSECPPNSFEQFSIETKTGKCRTYALNEENERLYYELKAFVDMVTASDWESNRKQVEQSLAVQRILDEARKQAGIKVPEYVENGYA